MNNQIEGEITCQYVRHGIGKKGNHWVQLSDGIEPKFFELAPDVDIQAERGDTFTARMLVNPFSGRGIVTELN